MKNLEWLKRMENGTIGEARTKEILIDRFWILERSVDINGADFIIQRKLPYQHISDNDPPKLGVVQAKYIQDKNTDIYIKYNYAMRSRDISRDEFFLIIHTGIEDNKKAFFLRGEQISKFTTIIRNGEKYFYISGAQLSANEAEYLIKSYKDVNDYIENSLIRSEYARNRSYLHSFFSNNNLTNLNDIDYKYTHQIYSRNEIPEMVFGIKESAISLREDLEMLVYDLTEIIDETDALKVVRRAEDLDGEISYDGKIYFNAKGISYRGEALETVEEYLKDYEKLKVNNKLNLFNLIKSKLADEIFRQINAVKMKKKPNPSAYGDYKIIPSNSCMNINIKYDEIRSSAEVNSQLTKVGYSKGQEMIELTNSTSGEINVIYRWHISGDLSYRNSIEQNVKEAVRIVSRVIDEFLIDDLTK